MKRIARIIKSIPAEDLALCALVIPSIIVIWWTA